MNIKKLNRIFTTIIFVILIATISAIYFSWEKGDKNYLALVNIHIPIKLDHIFLKSGEQSYLNAFAIRYFEETIPEYEWETKATDIRLKMYIGNKNKFYNKELPALEAKLRKNIPLLNKEIKDKIQSLLKDPDIKKTIDEDSSGIKIIYTRLSVKPYFSNRIKTQVSFRKLGLTKFEFLAVTLLLSLSSISLVTTSYLTQKKKITL